MNNAITPPDDLFIVTVYTLAGLIIYVIGFMSAGVLSFQRRRQAYREGEKHGREFAERLHRMTREQEEAEGPLLSPEVKYELERHLSENPEGKVKLTIVPMCPDERAAGAAADLRKAAVES